MDRQGKVCKMSDYCHSTMNYLSPNSVVKYAEDVKKSERNRYEILEVNKAFLEESKLQVQTIHTSCKWYDTYTPDNILLAANSIRQQRKI